MLKRLWLLVVLFSSPLALAAPGLPDAADMDASVPAPSDVLGFEPGERHPRHDQVVAYLNRLAESSDRVKLEVIGHSHGGRPQLVLYFSSPQRLAKLDQIRDGRNDAARKGEGPPVVWMGYSIHGNEASGTSAALVMAWYLAASRDEQVLRWLDDMVIIMEPALNPDGLDRFAHWVNMHRGQNPSADPNDREHAEGWPNGRTNYYWFDLNRDWLPVIHPVSKNRIALHSRWYPHVVTDHHEMGHNSTYFFQPGIPERTNPLISDANQALTADIAEFHARALDRAGQPHYTRESFDDYYAGKGSTYPDLTGGVGILFEQGSSRGVKQDTIFGQKHFEDTVANQVRTSISTLDAVQAHAEKLVGYQRDFFADVDKQARSWKQRGWLLGDGGDPARAHALIAMLLNHSISVQPVTDSVEIDGRKHDSGHAWFIPAGQDKYLLLKSMFEPVIEETIETFYDVSAWPMAMAHNLPIEAAGRAPAVGDALTETPVYRPARPAESAVAWLVDWRQYRADALAAELLTEGYRIQAAGEPLTIQAGDERRSFGRGTLIIHAGVQPERLDAVGPRLAELSEKHGVEVVAAEGSLVADGIDLGSPSAHMLKAPRPAMLTGTGINAYGAGTLWHWFDTRLEQPLARIDTDRLGRVDLNDYSHVIVPPTGFGGLDKDTAGRLADYVRAGGTLVALGNAAQWAESLDLGWSFVEEEQSDEDADSVLERRSYGDYRQDFAREYVGGSALEVQLDTTHPLGWGYDAEKLVVFRQGTHVLKQVDNPYVHAAAYADQPLVAGYLSQANRDRFAGTPAVSVTHHGQGRVVRIADDPLFRAYWRGGEKLFANALFFSALTGRTEL